MNKCRINIAIMEPSDIIYEGLSNLLLRYESHYFLYRLGSLEEFYQHSQKEDFDIAIINPLALINKMNDFIKLKKTSYRTIWIALLYTYVESAIVSKFDDTIGINDSENVITHILKQTAQKCHCEEKPQEELSERELEVLVQLLKGYSNKEIADRLHISIHTVVSHRKNIAEKTGIKSLPGLTIYAISKNIIPLSS